MPPPADRPRRSRRPGSVMTADPGAVVGFWEVLHDTGRTAGAHRVYAARCRRCAAGRVEYHPVWRLRAWPGCAPCRVRANWEGRARNRHYWTYKAVMGVRRKYFETMTAGRLLILDDGSKVRPGGRLVFYRCRCVCLREYVWPTRAVTRYARTGCPACRRVEARAARTGHYAAPPAAARGGPRAG